MIEGIQPSPLGELLGRCHDCERKIPRGQFRCARCRELRRTQPSYKSYKPKPCRLCGQSCGPGGDCCAKCRKTKCRARGCYELRSPGRNFCSGCLATKRKKERLASEQRWAAGCCGKCGRDIDGVDKFCERCRVSVPECHHGFVATLYRGAAPLVTIGVASDRDGETEVWPALEKMYLDLTDAGPFAAANFEAPSEPATLPLRRRERRNG
jgi:hypothetical protein